MLQHTRAIKPLQIHNSDGLLPGQLNLMMHHTIRSVEHDLHNRDVDSSEVRASRQEHRERVVVSVRCQVGPVLDVVGVDEGVKRGGDGVGLEEKTR